MLVNPNDVLTGLVNTKRADLVVIKDSLVLPALTSVNYTVPIKYLQSSFVEDRVGIIMSLQAHSDPEEVVTLDCSIDSVSLIRTEITEFFARGINFLEYLKLILPVRKTFALSFKNESKEDAYISFTAVMIVVRKSDYDKLIKQIFNQVFNFLSR